MDEATRLPDWKEMVRRDWTAEDLLDALRLYYPPVNILQIARDAGVRVAFFRDRKYSGALDASADPPIIWVKATDAPVRQRFTIAHELGHLLLHSGESMYRREPIFQDYQYADTDPEEQEANGFAAEILMPEPMVRAAFKVVGLNLRALAREFNVSPKAIGYRLKKLGLMR